jgi:hypothetical protein
MALEPRPRWRFQTARVISGGIESCPCAERTLDQSLFELLEKPVISGQVLSFLIVSK